MTDRKMATFVRTLRDCFSDLLACLETPAPIFVSRIGGSDTDAVVDYLRVKNLGPDELSQHIKRHRQRVSRFNGFYDRLSATEVYADYCEQLLDSYLAAQHLLLCNHQLLSIFFRDTLSPDLIADQFENKEGYEALIDTISSRV